MRCREPEFQRFLDVGTEADAVAAVRSRCGVQSRREFDTDAAAAKRLHQQIRIPFSEFHHQHNYDQESAHA
jgi:hypothetical protein